ncbi:hypothetical protein J6590_072354 [Homalodisca vitripennis]|nr:hypothetical protein J6590_072354 [Homalodisca vitripennis]
MRSSAKARAGTLCSPKFLKEVDAFRTPNYQRPKVQPLAPRVRPHVSEPAGWGKPAGDTPDPAVPVSLAALVGRVSPHRCTRTRPDRPRSRQGRTQAPTPPTARGRTPFAAEEPH